MGDTAGEERVLRPRAQASAEPPQEGHDAAVGLLAHPRGAEGAAHLVRVERVVAIVALLRMHVRHFHGKVFSSHRAHSESADAHGFKDLSSGTFTSRISVDILASYTTF